MKILQSNVSLSSEHEKSHEIKESEKLDMWNKKEDAPQRFRVLDRLEISEDFKALSTKISSNDELAQASLPPKILTMLRAIEMLTGRKIDAGFMQKLNPKDIKMPQENNSQESSQQELQGWGVDYSYEKTQIKKEQLDFSASGSVKTADGKSIDFSLALSMKSDIRLHESFSFKAGDALIDPLVINFGRDFVSFNEVKHNFDLDLDGKSDEFAFVGSGSGFLALDKNSDGIINNGSELFGPKSGNGFNELRAYDSDKNGWIDENDDVFSKLLIWTKDEEGVESLYSLKDKNIGAMYLGSTKTDFELRGEGTQTKAHLRESSIYLREDGGVGTIQEVDLVV